MPQTRNTAQLSIVRDALNALADHPTADEVFVHVHATHPSISRATVYRTLNKLAAQGEALKVHTPLGADRFDHATHPHAHVQCRACGIVADVGAQGLAAAIDEAETQSGFAIEEATMQFLGLCPACAACPAGAAGTAISVRTA